MGSACSFCFLDDIKSRNNIIVNNVKNIIFLKTNYPTEMLNITTENSANYLTNLTKYFFLIYPKTRDQYYYTLIILMSFIIYFIHKNFAYFFIIFF